MKPFLLLDYYESDTLENQVTNTYNQKTLKTIWLSSYTPNTYPFKITIQMVSSLRFGYNNRVIIWITKFQVTP